jgi:hypothetical protein
MSSEWNPPYAEQLNLSTEIYPQRQYIFAEILAKAIMAEVSILIYGYSQVSNACKLKHHIQIPIHTTCISREKYSKPRIYRTRWDQRFLSVICEICYMCKPDFVQFTC